MLAPLALFGQLLVGGPAEAPSGAAAPRVDWRDDGECPQMAELPGRVEALLSASELETEGLEVLAEMQGRRNGFELRMELRLPDAEPEIRELRGPRCASLVDAGALMIALAVDPLVLDHLLEPPATAAPQIEGLAVDPVAVSPAPRVERPIASGAGEGSEPERAELAPRRSPPASAPRDGADAHRVRLALRSSLGCCVTPSLNFGLAGGVGWLLRPRWLLEVGARHAFRRVQVLEGETGGIGVSSTAARIRACVRGTPEGASIEWLACAGGEGGVLVGRSSDVTPRMQRTVGWGAALVSAGLRWPAEGRVALAVDLESWVPFDRVFFKFPQVTGVYAPEWVGVRVALGADLRFGRPATQKGRRAATKS